MRLKILPSAREDLIEGYRFYERQATGVGSYFLDSLLSDIDSLMLNAGIHPVYHGHYHRLLSKRFPFAIYYRMDEDVAVVHAVLDCRRNPAWTRRKLG